ncbi:hypothetical protein [Pseudogemmobacter humi]|uniref:Outer membrane efflux protein n=1 Tax=Pseudogemmobacter humi TaxID=2483812 RepID=A0A3P5WTU0_9RHOB|nr:hypothetical protein [Pseudogemmobacter humi]VDC24702.1 hypothetical protein XINFAN_01274 [Pseudogemmobacter humi]
MMRGLILGLVLVLNAACRAPEYDRAAALVDQVDSDLANPDKGAALPFAQHARRHGPGFRQARLREASLWLELDELRRGALPRFSLLMQGTLQLRSDPAALELRGRNHAFVIEWDFVRALYVFFRRTPETFARLVAQDSALAVQEAEKDLLDQLAAALLADLDLERDALRLQAEQCLLQQMRSDLAAGAVAGAAVAEKESEHRRLQALTGAVRTLNAATWAKLSHSGGGAPVQPRPTITALLPVTRISEDAAQCYAGSALRARNDALHDIALGGLEAARIEKWLNLSGIVPNQLGSQNPARIELLLNLMVPLIDQGRGDRQVMQARIAVANALITAGDSRAAFLLAHARMRVTLAEAELEMLRPATPPATDDCTAVLSARQDDIARRRAALTAAHMRASLHLLCTPAASVPARE